MDKLKQRNIGLISGLIFLLSISTITATTYSQEQIQNNQTQQPKISEGQKLQLATMLANTNAELFNKVGEITQECTYSTVAANSISDECFNFVKDVKNAMKPIVDKYENILTSSTSFSSIY